MESKVTVSFPIRITHDSNGGHGLFVNADLSGIEYGSDARIKAKLRTRAEAEIAEGLRLLKENYRGRVIGCNDGSVLVVRFMGGTSWGYSVYAARLKGGSACVGSKDFDTAVADAKRHAEGSYGGVAWENSL